MSFKILHDEVVFDGKYISVVRRHFLARSQTPQIWEMVKRKTFGKIVAVCPITPENEIVLVKIFRVPLQCYVIELCAGLMDKPNESEEDAIRRELLEETGYQVGELTRLLDGPFNTGLLTDEIIIFLGRDAHKVCEPKLDDAEDIEVVKIPIKDVHNYLMHPPQGVKVDIKIFSILPWLGIEMK